MADIEEVRRVRDLLGMGIMEIGGGMERAGTDDPLLGALYSAAASLAVVIKGDRHAWNLRYAHGRYDEFAPRLEQMRREAEGRTTD